MTSLLSTLGSLRAHLEDSDFDTDVDVITSRGEAPDSLSPGQWPRDSSGDSGTSMWYEEDDDYETLVEYEKPPPLPTSAPPKLPRPQPARRPDTLWSASTGPPPPPLPVRHSTSSSHRVPGERTPPSQHHGSYPSKFTAPSSHVAPPPRPQRDLTSSPASARGAMSPGVSRSAASPGVGTRHAERCRGGTGFPGPQGKGSAGACCHHGAVAGASPSGGLRLASPQRPAPSPQYPDVFDSPVLVRRVSSDMANAFFSSSDDTWDSSPSPKFARAPSTPDTPVVTPCFPGQLPEGSFTPCPEDTSSRRPSKTFAPCTPRPPHSTSLTSSSSPVLDSPSSTCSSRAGSLTPDSALPSPQGEQARGLQRCDRCGKWRNKRKGAVARQLDRARGETTLPRRGGAERSASASDLVQMGGGKPDHGHCGASPTRNRHDGDVRAERHRFPPPLRRGISADVGVMARLLEQARLDKPSPSANQQEQRRLSGAESRRGGDLDQKQPGPSCQSLRSGQGSGEVSKPSKMQGNSQKVHSRQERNGQSSPKDGDRSRDNAQGGHRNDVRNVRSHQVNPPHSEHRAGVEHSHKYIKRHEAERKYQASPQRPHSRQREAEAGRRHSQSSREVHQRDVFGDHSSPASQTFQVEASASSAVAVQSHSEDPDARVRGPQVYARSSKQQQRNWRGSSKDLREEKSHYRSSDFLKQLNIPTELPPLSSESKFGGSSKDLRESTSNLLSGKDHHRPNAMDDDLCSPRRLHKGLRSRSSKDLREISHGSLFGGPDAFGLSRSREDISGSRMSRCSGSSKDLTQLSRDNMDALNSSFFGESSGNLTRLSRMGGSSKDIVALYTGSQLGGSSKNLSNRLSDTRHHREFGVLSSVSKFGGSSWELSGREEGERTKTYNAGASSMGDNLDRVGLDSLSGSTHDLSRCARSQLQPRDNGSSLLDSLFGGSAKDISDRRRRLGQSCENLNDVTVGGSSNTVSRDAECASRDLPPLDNRRKDFGGSDPNLLETALGFSTKEATCGTMRRGDADYKSVTFVTGAASHDGKSGKCRDSEPTEIQRISAAGPRVHQERSSSGGPLLDQIPRTVKKDPSSTHAHAEFSAARRGGGSHVTTASRRDGFPTDLPPGSRGSIFGSQWDLVQLNQSVAASTRMGGSSKDIREVHHVTHSNRQSASMWDVRDVSQGAPTGCDVFRISDMAATRGHRASHVTDSTSAEPSPPAKKKIIFEILV